jgi:hypothetical protein
MQVCAACNRPLGHGKGHYCQVCFSRHGPARTGVDEHTTRQFEAAPVPTLEQIEQRCREIRQRWSEEVTAVRMGVRMGTGGLGWQPPLVRTSEIGLFEDAPWT